MNDRITGIAMLASEVPPRAKPTHYPKPVADMPAAVFAGREKRPLGEAFGLTNFGVHLTRLAPGAASALRHAHSSQDELICVLEGNPTLHTDEGMLRLAPGMCAGFKAGTGNAHCLINETAQDVVFLEIGDRTDGDEVHYPEADLKAAYVDGVWVFSHKDGTPYY